MFSIICLFLLSLAFSKEICLVRSELVIGQDKGETIDHYPELVQFMTGDISLFKFKTCYDETTEEIVGLQFTLRSHTIEKLFELSAIGDVSGTCRTLELSQPLDAIKA